MGRYPASRVAVKPPSLIAGYRGKLASMPTLEDLRAAAERVRAAAETLDDIRAQRDDLIRNVRRSTEHTVPEIADAAGVSQATVKTVIRGLR